MQRQLTPEIIEEILWAGEKIVELIQFPYQVNIKEVSGLFVTNKRLIAYNIEPSYRDTFFRNKESFYITLHQLSNLEFMQRLITTEAKIFALTGDLISGSIRYVLLLYSKDDQGKMVQKGIVTHYSHNSYRIPASFQYRIQTLFKTIEDAKTKYKSQENKFDKKGNPFIKVPIKPRKFKVENFSAD